MQSQIAIPLSDMEKLLWFRHSSQHPNLIFCRLSCSGSVDRDKFEEAVEIAFSRHPMMRSKLDTQSWQWVRTDIQPVEWHDREFDPDNPPGRPIELTETNGLRIDVCDAGKGRVEIIFQVHHATADAVGSLIAAVDLLLIYQNLCTGQPASHKLRPLDDQQLLKRNKIGMFSKGWIRRLPAQWIPFYGLLKFKLGRIARLTDLPDDSLPLPASFPSCMARKLDVDLYARLKNLALQSGATVNEWILAAVFQSVGEWQARHGFNKQRNKLRVLIPINRREFPDRRCSACNKISLIQLDRKVEELNDTRNLIWGINYELGIIRKFKFDRFPNLVLRLMNCVPGLISRSAASRKNRATTYFTNLGSALDRVKLPKVGGKLQSGDLIVDQIQYIAPHYKDMPVSFVFYGYNGQFEITMHYDSRVLSKELAAELADGLIETINHMASQQ